MQTEEDRLPKKVEVLKKPGHFGADGGGPTT